MTSQSKPDKSNYVESDSYRPSEEADGTFTSSEFRFNREFYGRRMRRSKERGYSGLGPKGYFRTDESIKDEACDILTFNRELDASEIEVEVTDGCLFLRGMVADRADKRLAEDLVEYISGVKDVFNELRFFKEYFHNEKVGHTTGLIKGLT